MATATKKLPWLLTIREAADALGVGVRTLREWIASGRIPITRIGPRTVRIRDDDLLAFIDAGRETTSA